MDDSISPWMAWLKRVVEEDDTLGGRVFDYVVFALILLTVVTFSIETLPNLPDGVRSALHSIELCTVTLFTLEYILRLVIADRKLGFVFSFFGIVDLLAILPFYIASGVDLRSVRAFRLLRLFRVFKMLRYIKAIHRFHEALLLAKEEIILFLFITGLLLYFSAVGIYFFEHDAQPEVFSSVFHSLWWAVATLTTVGYGDVYPITPGGRIFTFFVLIIGLGVVSVPAGLVASALSKARELGD